MTVYHRGDWFGLFQAIGTVSAILMSGVLVAWQARSARKLSERQRTQHDDAVLSAFRAIAEHAGTLVSHMLLNLSDLTTARGYFQGFQLEAITSVEAMVDRFPLHDLPTRDRVLQAAEFRHFLALSRNLLLTAQAASQLAAPDWKRIIKVREECSQALKRSIAKIES